MERYLYVFAGFPRNGLNAGGIQHAIEKVEELAILEHDSSVQLRKEGTFLLSPDRKGEEWAGGLNIIISRTLARDGIGYDWFPEDWPFGNGVTVHKTQAHFQEKVVVHGTTLSLNEMLSLGQPIDLAAIQLEKIHERTEGWEKYEARWEKGKCPQEAHLVHLTWLISKYRIPEFAYLRIQELIEGKAPEIDRSQFEDDHFSVIRQWNRTSNVGREGMIV